MALGRNLQGLRVLVVEDEALVCMLLEDTLSDIGCKTAGVATSLDEALNKASTLSFDAVVLDVNLNGDNTFSVAEWLNARGIPYLFSTGYGAAGIPENFSGVPVLQKPFQERDLEAALRTALAANIG